MRLHYLRGLAMVLAVVMSIAAATAGEIDLNRTQTIVTGQDPSRHGDGMIECLRRVLVKVSGDPRLSDDPRIAGLASGMKNYIAAITLHDRFAGRQIHDEQGSRDRPFDLIVDFKPGDIDLLLRGLGRKPWPLPRPELLLLVTVGRYEKTFVLTREGRDASGMPEAVAAAGDRFGVSVMLPSERDSAGHDLPADALKEVLPVISSQPAVVGTLVWAPEKHGWTAVWRLHGTQGASPWSVSGVNFDAAFRSAVGGATQILSGN